ncbi:MAG TPA: metal-binding protein, partial [Rhizobiales bacterium]|nr:metal-binding protein [Hyphomicrobiales bacterium]
MADTAPEALVRHAGALVVAALVALTLLAWLALLAGAGTDMDPAAMMSSRSLLLSGTLLIAAGLYQLTPLKAACLKHCRGPAEFIAAHWRPGVLGAWRMGL